MEAFKEIQQLWLTTNVKSLPEPEAVISMIRAHRRKQMIKSGIGIVIGMALFGLMVWVVFGYNSLLLSTRIGEVCLLLALVVFL
jgi:ferric-dicitrate binding protein FerR (iron transport regulator)